MSFAKHAGRPLAVRQDLFQNLQTSNKVLQRELTSNHQAFKYEAAARIIPSRRQSLCSRNSARLSNGCNVRPPSTFTSARPKRLRLNWHATAASKDAFSLKRGQGQGQGGFASDQYSPSRLKPRRYIQCSLGRLLAPRETATAVKPGCYRFLSDAVVSSPAPFAHQSFEGIVFNVTGMACQDDYVPQQPQERAVYISRIIKRFSNGTEPAANPNQVANWLKTTIEAYDEALDELIRYINVIVSSRGFEYGNSWLPENAEEVELHSVCSELLVYLVDRLRLKENTESITVSQLLQQRALMAALEKSTNQHAACRVISDLHNAAGGSSWYSNGSWDFLERQLFGDALRGRQLRREDNDRALALAGFMKAIANGRHHCSDVVHLTTQFMVESSPDSVIPCDVRRSKTWFKALSLSGLAFEFSALQSFTVTLWEIRRNGLIADLFGPVSRRERCSALLHAWVSQDERLQTNSGISRTIATFSQLEEELEDKEWSWIFETPYLTMFLALRNNGGAALADDILPQLFELLMKLGECGPIGQIIGRLQAEGQPVDEGILRSVLEYLLRHEPALAASILYNDPRRFALKHPMYVVRLIEAGVHKTANDICMKTLEIPPCTIYEHVSPYVDISIPHVKLLIFAAETIARLPGQKGAVAVHPSSQTIDQKFARIMQIIGLFDTQPDVFPEEILKSLYSVVIHTATAEGQPISLLRLNAANMVAERYGKPEWKREYTDIADELNMRLDLERAQNQRDRSLGKGGARGQ